MLVSINQFEIDNKAKDKHAAICKDCFVKRLVNVPIGIVTLIATTVVAD